MSLSRIALALLGGTAVIGAGGCAMDGGRTYSDRTDATQRQVPAQQNMAGPYHYRTHETASYGRVYVNAEGRALYGYQGDRMNQSTCYGQCARRWQPFLASGDARPHGQWSIIERDDGTRQWAYAGRPSYTWSGDREPGAVTGHGRDGTWWVMRAAQP
jgi:predicted lipoprotein with Yx(FWY)xxD motif